MDVRQCKECGKLFQYVGNPNCPECIEMLDELFVKVRDYIYKNPDATIKEVSEKTEIKERILFDFLKEDRLSLKDATGILQCERCRKPINAGRFCNDCKLELEQALQPPAAARPAPAPPADSGKRASKMYVRKEW